MTKHHHHPHSLADSFARAGFLVVAPDMFDGEPAPLDFDTPGFNATEFTLKHGPNATDPILAKAVAYLKTTGVEKIAATGYCYGGRYTFRVLAAGGVDVGFAAHPSLLEDPEILAITGPISVAAAGKTFIRRLPSELSILWVLLLTIPPFRNRRDDAAREAPRDGGSVAYRRSAVPIHPVWWHLSRVWCTRECFRSPAEVWQGGRFLPGG